MPSSAPHVHSTILELIATDGARDARIPPAIQVPNLPAIFRLASQLHVRGSLTEAESIYRSILAAKPDHFDSLHMLGVLHHQRGEHGRALEVLHRAAAIERGGAGFHRHLGEVHRALLHYDDAERSFLSALHYDPDDHVSACNLGHVYLQQGRTDEAEAWYRRALALRPDDADANLSLALVLARRSPLDEAIARCERAVASDPRNVEARHILASLRGEKLLTCPARYVADLFDRYAPTFDSHLTGVLKYRIPEKLRSAVESCAPANGARLHIADLGCGTGLCGEAFADLAAHLTGIDLSAEMIARAKQRRIYDRLIHGDLADALLTWNHGLDLIVAGDVLIYVGELDVLFRRASIALRANGVFAFSTERCEGEGYRLQTTGRFAHSEAYVRSLAGANGMTAAYVGDAVIRTEARHAIDGQVFVLRRTV